MSDDAHGTLQLLPSSEREEPVAETARPALYETSPEAEDRQETEREADESPAAADAAGEDDVMRSETQQSLQRSRKPHIKFDFASLLLSLLPNFQRAARETVRGAFALPHAGLSKQLGEMAKDMMLSKEQQDVMERVLACNKNFWKRAVEGSSDSGPGPAWKRHVGLNLALLREYHCELAADRIARALGEHRKAPLDRSGIAEALRYIRHALAAYCERWQGMPPNSSEAQLVEHAGFLAKIHPRSIVSSLLHDATQKFDPLCPRYYIALDMERHEVVLSVRGTKSISDTMVDLIGDPVPFAGGFAHDGMIDGARRLWRRCADGLQEALERLQAVARSPSGEARRAKLVLVGHSLGAGVAELLAILLKGGEPDEDGWLLPDSVDLQMYLYAPPPVYQLDTSRQDEAALKGQAAAAAAASGGIGFCMNFDIIPRTSLHNGYNLFQQARAVDRHCQVRSRDLTRLLAEASSDDTDGNRARKRVAALVQTAIDAAAQGAPAAPNPYSRQNPVVSSIYHIMGAPGGTAARGLPPPLQTFAPPRSSSEEDDSSDSDNPTPPSTEVVRRERKWSFRGMCLLRPFGRGCDDSEEDPATARRLSASVSDGVWIYKQSKKLGHWKRRFVSIFEGELRVAHNETSEPTIVAPLTAGATKVVVFDKADADRHTSFPDSVVDFELLELEEPKAESPVDARSASKSQPSTPAGYRGRLRSSLRGRVPPKPWAFQVDTSVVYGLCAARAETVTLACDDEATRDILVGCVVRAVMSARNSCYRMLPPMRAEDWGHEALLANQFAEDHSILRYEAALEGLLVGEAGHQALPEAPARAGTAESAQPSTVTHNNVREEMQPASSSSSSFTADDDRPAPSVDDPEPIIAASAEASKAAAAVSAAASTADDASSTRTPGTESP
eukprot:TRINITY_DN351_c0_g1_i1.p1 TRINITY_DN351_c0_g1~~TRINITY_DN351_c0_g1_i1.p1  ORF type:complete len:940 (+),score=187.91 TRINITY_DN351_c0_g1_i1:115-2820(+)